MTAKVTIDDRALDTIAGMGEVLPTNTAKRMLRVSEYITGVIRKHAPKGRTGAVMRSFHPTVVVSKKGRITGGSHSTYNVARVRDEGTGYLPGGVITGKRGNLAIPISDKAKRTVGLWPRDWPKGKLQLIDRSKKGRPPLLVEIQKKRWTIHYVLKKSVRQKGTYYLNASMPESNEIAMEELGVAVKTTIEGK